MHDPQHATRPAIRPSSSSAPSSPHAMGCRSLVGLCLSLGLALLTGSPLWADGAPSDRWNARAYALWFYPEDDEIQTVTASPAPLPAETTFHSITDGGGFGLELELMAHQRLGIEVAAMAGDLDTDFRVESGPLSLTDSGEIGVEVYTLGLNYHLTPHKRADVHVGVLGGILFFDDIIFLTEVGRRDKLTFDDDTGFGIKVGIDVPFTAESRWYFSASVRYLVAILEGETAGQDLDFNPFLPALGFGVRF